MTLQMLTIGKREFVLVSKRDFDKLAAQAQLQTEDDYWTEAALEAERRAHAKGEKPIPFDQVERAFRTRKPGRTGPGRPRRR